MQSQKDWWKNSIVYQINPLSFCDSNGDSIGDITGIASKLHYFKDLGVDVLWLDPIYPNSNPKNSGEEGKELSSITFSYCENGEIDKLVSKAKRLGIKVFVGSDFPKETQVEFSYTNVFSESKHFKFLKIKEPAKKIISNIDKWQNIDRWPADVFEAPGSQRAIVRIGDDEDYWLESAKLICGLQLSLRGTPVLNQGQEFGVKEVNSKFYFDFTSDESNLILDFYKKMIDFRKNSSALSNGDYRRIASEKDIFVFSRMDQIERLYIYCNMSPLNRVVEFYGDKVILDNYASNDMEEKYLKPYEFRILKSNF